MKYKTIGIISAMPQEVTHLFAQIESAKEETLAGVAFSSGTLMGHNVVACCAGMGKANAAAATQLLISRFGCEAVVFSGIAGNMNNTIGVGDVVIGARVVYHDAEISCLAQSYPFMDEFRGDEALCQAAEKACKACGVTYLTGTIATGDQFVGDATLKADIAMRCSPDCVEMEGAAVAHIACKNDVPFVIIRAMSDNCDTALEDFRSKEDAKEFDIDDYCTTAARICQSILENI